MAEGINVCFQLLETWVARWCTELWVILTEVTEPYGQKMYQMNHHIFPAWLGSSS